MPRLDGITCRPLGGHPENRCYEAGEWRGYLLLVPITDDSARKRVLGFVGYGQGNEVLPLITRVWRDKGGRSISAARNWLYDQESVLVEALRLLNSEKVAYEDLLADLDLVRLPATKLA